MTKKEKSREFFNNIQRDDWLNNPLMGDEIVRLFQMNVKDETYYPVFSYIIMAKFEKIRFRPELGFTNTEDAIRWCWRQFVQDSLLTEASIILSDGSPPVDNSPVPS